MEELNNGKISVRSRRLSAELCALRNEETGEDLLWNADPKFWDRHCPMLFPTVGALWEGRYRHRGVWRAMPKHGFLQNAEFGPAECGDNFVAYHTHDTAATRRVYPFSFGLEQRFTLSGRTLCVDWTVDNYGAGPMPFHIGGHPSFFFRGFVPGDDVKGYLQFDAESPESATVGCGGCLGLGRYRLAAPGGLMPLRDSDFRGDSLIIDRSQVHSVTLLDKERRPVVKVSSEAPVFLVWSPYGVDAPFVCIEPWYGLCDCQGYNGEFASRPYTNTAPARGKWSGGYTIEVL